MSTTVNNPPSNMLLAPPKGVPPRGTSYPPPSPPLRRSPALTFNRNPPLLKTRHISGSQTSSIVVSYDAECTINTGTDICYSLNGSLNFNLTNVRKKDLYFSVQENQTQLPKRLARSDNKRYHTTGIVDDLKVKIRLYVVECSRVNSSTNYLNIKKVFRVITKYGI